MAKRLRQKLTEIGIFLCGRYNQHGKGVALQQWLTFCAQNQIIKAPDFTQQTSEKIFRKSTAASTFKPVKGVYLKAAPQQLGALQTLDESRFCEALLRVAAERYREQDGAASQLRCLMHYNLHVKDP